MGNVFYATFTSVFVFVPFIFIPMFLHLRPGGEGRSGWVGGPLDASFRLYLKEVFQSQTNTEDIGVVRQ